MLQVSYDRYLPEFYQKLSHQGVFLTVKDKNGSVNTMTIGWAGVGFMWSRPMMTVMVRASRYTYELLQNADCFTVSMPRGDGLDSALAYCGTRSGRDGDKFSACSLTMLPGQTVDCPVIREAWLHYECKIRSTAPMTEPGTDPALLARHYADHDLHTFFFGEITAVYCAE